MIDELIKCPHCDSEFCYQTIHESLASFSCLTCGFMSNSMLMNNTEYIKAYEETLPQLYIDIKKIDESGLVWYPMTVNKSKEGKGIVFANGSGADNWGWTFAPMTLVLPEEKERFKQRDGSYATYKTDMSKAEHFNKNDFSLAISKLDLI